MQEPLIETPPSRVALSGTRRTGRVRLICYDDESLAPALEAALVVHGQIENADLFSCVLVSPDRTTALHTETQAGEGVTECLMLRAHGDVGTTAVRAHVIDGQVVA